MTKRLTHDTFLLDIHNGHQYIIKALKSYSLNKSTNCNLSCSNLLDLGNLLTMSIILWNNYSKKYIWEMCTSWWYQFSTSRKIVTVHHCFYGMKSWQWTFWCCILEQKSKILYETMQKLSTNTQVLFYNGELLQISCLYFSWSNNKKMIPWK